MSFDSLFEFTRKVTTGAAAFTILLGSFLFLTDNTKVKGWVADMAGSPEIIINLSTLNQRVEELTRTVDAMDKRLSDADSIGGLSSDPVIKFSGEGNFITDARPGQLVTFTIRSVKLRECGRAEVNAWFKNGIKVAHAFEDLSIVDDNGRSIRAPANLGEVLERSFTARVPNSEGVTPGIATGWLEISYPDCPRVPVEISEGITFQILDEDGRPVNRERAVR